MRRPIKRPKDVAFYMIQGVGENKGKFSFVLMPTEYCEMRPTDGQDNIRYYGNRGATVIAAKWLARSMGWGLGQYD